MSNHAAAMAHPLHAQVVTGGTAGGNTLVRRTLCVHVCGSLANLALAGPQAGMWKAASGKEPLMFCPTLQGDVDPGQTVDNIRHGVVRSVTVLEQESTFPFLLGVSLSCVPPAEVTDLGETYAYTVLPRARLAASETVYACDPSVHESSVWRQNYSEWNTHNLESHGVMDVTNQPYVFVHMGHPVIGLLRHNADLIGCDIDKQPMIDKQYFKVTRQVLATCCDTLRKSVLSKMQTHDLNLFSLQLHRLNATGWDDFGDAAMQDFQSKAKWSSEELETHKEHHLRQFVTTPYRYTARLQIEYEVPTAASAA
jgi:hypothetical protein